MMELPRIISVDDHVVEPPMLWQDRLSRADREHGPRVERCFGHLDWDTGGKMNLVEDPAGTDGARWCDVWVYEDFRWPLRAGWAAVGELREVESVTPIVYEDMLPGCYQKGARLADMDRNHVEASLCFPTFPRFCGQTFMERKDHHLGFRCVQAYNDWMIDDWCAGEAAGRLIPLTLVPLWDPQLAADEVRRCAAKGSHAIAFSEIPPYLGLPSIYSGHWDVLFAACDETATVVNMHVGSASKLTTTSDDAPIAVWAALTVQNAQAAFVDWLCSGVLAKYPGLKIAFSEGQVGWMPFMMERLDSIWERSDSYDKNMRTTIPQRPSDYVPGRIYGCIFDDVQGLLNRSAVGMGQIMFETDYPHADSTFPDSRATVEKLAGAAGLSDQEIWQFVRGNAIECYGLSRFGITE
jgi:predicted TIM-barrel fold metal-dependent hydrolase